MVLKCSVIVGGKKSNKFHFDVNPHMHINYLAINNQIEICKFDGGDFGTWELLLELLT